MTRLLENMPDQSIAAIYARWLKLQEDEKSDEPKGRGKRRRTERRISLGWLAIGWCPLVKTILAFWWF